MHCGFESAITGSIAKGNLKKHIRAITTNFRVHIQFQLPSTADGDRVPVHYSLSIVKQKFTAWNHQQQCKAGWKSQQLLCLVCKGQYRSQLGLTKYKGLMDYRPVPTSLQVYLALVLLTVLFCCYTWLSTCLPSQTPWLKSSACEKRNVANKKNEKLSCWTVNSMMCIKGKCNRTLLSTKSKPSAQNLVDFSSWLPLKV